jgi:hypothetical protein
MTADEAGQSWLDRTTEIIQEYGDPSYDRAQVHDEAARAAQGINALLENRSSEISPQMFEWLGQAVDVNAKINADTLDASFQSPWRSAASGFGQDLAQEAKAGLRGVKDAAAAAAKKFEFDLTFAVTAAIVILGVLYVANAKLERAVA